MQSVACNAYHSIPERTARWLLHAQDRTGDRIELTQQALAGLLGAQRTTVNAVVQAFERDGLIATGRGIIRVEDRAGLTSRSCECYLPARGAFRRGDWGERKRARFAPVTGDQLFVMFDFDLTIAAAAAAVAPHSPSVLFSDTGDQPSLARRSLPFIFLTS